MNSFAYKIGLRLTQIGYIRRAIDDKADLSAFKERPDWRIFLGMFLIALSFVMCWPVITVLGALSLRWDRPWIGVVGGTIIYFSSHLVHIAGMYLCGAKYSAIVFRWMTRKGVEKLLSRGSSEPVAPIQQGAAFSEESRTR